mgnify:FL=1
MRQSEINTIHKLSKKEALLLLLPQIYIMSDSQKAGKTLELFSEVLERIPIYEFRCNISEQAVKCSFDILTAEN